MARDEVITAKNLRIRQKREGPWGGTRSSIAGQAQISILRGLAARAPYFHNGSAQTLLEVVHFYENRFGLVLTPQEESDLVAFLNAL